MKTQTLLIAGLLGAVVYFVVVRQQPAAAGGGVTGGGSTGTSSVVAQPDFFTSIVNAANSIFGAINTVAQSGARTQ